MAESKSHARVKKTLESSKELTKTTRENVAKEREKILEIITNNIVESRIDEKETMLKALAELYNENEAEAIDALKFDEAQEKKILSEEYESIVKKQLQMLQADERGKQALLNQISNIKQEQKKRSDALKARKKALLIEKERSKRIAALPPPLPKSVKLLLKEHDKKEPITLTGSTSSPTPLQEPYPVEEEIDVFEDKENMENEMSPEERRQLQEEWDRKAKKRYNEALRKDRLKQEHAKILKEIEDAEKVNRRQSAKNLSEPGGNVPCPLSDRLNHMEKRAALEDAVEGIFKKPSTTKEHAIEDLEGYEDKWEAKYKKIDSHFEAKMIDCVPNFVKQNYSYLLEEEPSQQCGSRFARLDDSADDLNVAYIESPTDRMSGSDKIAAAISHLGQMMSESNEIFERDFKPLLAAEILKADQSKRESFDKAVEANLLKRPTEDKSIDVQEEMSSRTVVPFASTSTQADFMTSGVMAFKRRSSGSKNKLYLGSLSDPRAQPPTWMEPETVPSNGSWSSSSYLSLQSRVGKPDICNLCDSPSCKLPLVEGGKGHHKDCIPMSKSTGKVEKDALERKSTAHPREVLERSNSSERSQEDVSNKASTSAEEKSRVLSFVQLIAQKYLKKQQEEFEEHAGSAREDEIHLNETPERAISGGHVESKESESTAYPPTDAVPKPSTSELSASKKSKTQLARMEFQDGTITTDEKSLTDTDKPRQDQFVQRCHEILSEKLSNLFMEEDGEAESEVLSALKSAVSEEGKTKLAPGDFVYHELSTILEMDSALTNDMPSLRDASKKTSRSSSLSSLSRKSDEFISPEEVDTTSASLVDAPGSEAVESAKNIQFVAKPSKSVAEPKTPLSLITGTLSSIQTPSPQVVVESLGKRPESSSKYLEPKTPLGTGTLADIQTPSPCAVTEAPPIRPFVVAEHLKTPSQITIHSDISTPSTLKTISSCTLGSKDLSTPTSQLSPQSRPSESVEVTPYSSSLRFQNVKYPFLTNLTDDLPQYFKDISNIQHDILSQDKNRQADDRQTVPKNVQSHATSKQFFFPKKFDGKFQTDEDSGGSFKPMTPHSCVSSPGAIPTEHDNKSKEGSSSSSFKPMTPHSYFSSPGALPTEPYTKSKNGYDHQQEDNGGRFQMEKTSSSSFKPMTPHSYVSSQGEMHTEPGNKSKDAHPREPKLPKPTDEPLHSTENSQASYKPMASRFYLPSPIEMPGQTDRLNAIASRDFANHKVSSSKKGSESQRSSNSNFQPMTPHTHTPSNFSPQDNKDAHKTLSPTKRPPINITKSESSESEVSTPRTISPSQKIKDWIMISSDSTTPHYRISSPNHLSQSHGLVPENEDKAPDAKVWTSVKSSVDNFQPMTQHSYLSTPNLNSLGTNQSPEKKSNHRRILSPLRNERYRTENSNDGFQPMMPHTYQSTPNLPSQTQQHPTEENDGERCVATENSNGFQPMTPHSYISSEENVRAGSTSSVNLRLKIPQSLLSGSNQETTLTQDGQNTIPSSVSSKSLRLRFGVKGQGYQNSNADVQYFTVGDGSQLQKPVEFELNDNGFDGKHSRIGNGLRNEVVDHGLKDIHGEQRAKKVPRSDFFVPQLSSADMAIAKEAQKSQQESKKNSALRNEIVEYLVKDASKENKAVKVSRSDFFVPQLSSADLAIQQKFREDQKSTVPTKASSSGFFVPTPNEIPRSRKGYFSSDISDVSSMRSSDIRTCTDSTPSTSSLTGTCMYSTSSLSSLTSSVSSITTKELSRIGTVSSQGGSGSLSSLSSETPNFSVDSPNPILEALRKKFASDSSSKPSSLYCSPLSTQGPLSDTSVSKITNQSTPMKTIEDIIQETGIMDEPDLTLVTTNLTIKPGTPERTRLFSESHSLIKAPAQSNNEAIQGMAVTPNTGAGNSSADTPSMMSFLQHETSCLGESKNGEYSFLTCDIVNENHIQHPITHDIVNENLMHDDDFGRQFVRNQPKYDYQKRTKRLWNNLEEVKSKKMMEEKKKKIAENRLKMKSYTRVYKKN